MHDLGRNNCGPQLSRKDSSTGFELLTQLHRLHAGMSCIHSTCPCISISLPSHALTVHTCIDICWKFEQIMNKRPVNKTCQKKCRPLFACRKFFPPRGLVPSRLHNPGHPVDYLAVVIYTEQSSDPSPTVCMVGGWSIWPSYSQAQWLVGLHFENLGDRLSLPQLVHPCMDAWVDGRKHHKCLCNSTSSNSILLVSILMYEFFSLRVIFV